MTACRSCGRSIWWAVNEATGSLMPLDHDPTDQGNVALVGRCERTDRPMVRVLHRALAQHPVLFTDPELEEDRPLWLSHHATCPNGVEWRQR